LIAEIQREGPAALLDHLHLCGAIPEEYGHDTSEEKLYSKYTDALLSATFRQIGLTSIVLTERADAADVEAVGPNYALVADAKAFRLSRTAKNQKDFKIEALHGWKRGKPHISASCSYKSDLPTSNHSECLHLLVLPSRHACSFLRGSRKL
jgi:type II restriction enzyme